MADIEPSDNFFPGITWLFIFFIGPYYYPKQIIITNVVLIAAVWLFLVFFLLLIASNQVFYQYIVNECRIERIRISKPAIISWAEVTLLDLAHLDAKRS